MSIHESIAARVQALSGDAPLEAPTEAPAAPAEVAAPEAAPTEAPTAAPEAAADPAAKHTLLEEKLAAVREQRRGVRAEAERARREREAAEADRKAAAEERAKYDGLKNGTFLETMKALGHDPRQAFEEMKQEAIEAGTPEAQLRRMQENFDRQLKAAVEPLQKSVEDLKKERDDLQKNQFAMAVQADFSRAVEDEAFVDLRIEYDDQQLFAIADQLREAPARFHALRKQLQVPLTREDGKFTMRDILQVLKAKQAEHERGKQARSAKLRPAVTQQAAQAPADSRAVNGTTDRRNPLGNNLAADRASTTSSAPRPTRQQKIQKLIAGG